MKWVFLAALLFMVPLLTAILKARPKYLLHACFFMGLLLFFLDPYLYVAPISWSWPGPVKGVEVSVLDAIAVSMILATRSIRIPASAKVGLAVYLASLAVSTIAAGQFMPSAFYGWQLLRGLLVFMAVARVTAVIPSAPVALLAGLGTAIVFQAGLATKQYLGGNGQPGGTLGHRNMLGLTSHFAVMPAYALLISGRRSMLAGLVVLSGAVIALVGGSRATIGLFAIGLAITTILSMRHKITGRKSAFAAAAVVALALSVPAMMWAIERRPAEARTSSNEERKALTEAARMIIADYPLGIGANHYVIVANVGGYSNRAGVAWNYTSRSAPVHNSYYLITAELGFLGLIGFATLLLSMIYTGLAALGRAPPNERSDLLVGFMASLIVVCAHLAFEWLYMTFFIHYLLAMTMGALVGISASLKASRPLGRPRVDFAPRLASQPSYRLAARGETNEG